MSEIHTVNEVNRVSKVLEMEDEPEDAESGVHSEPGGGPGGLQDQELHQEVDGWQVQEGVYWVHPPPEPRAQAGAQRKHQLLWHN